MRQCAVLLLLALIPFIGRAQRQERGEDIPNPLEKNRAAMAAGKTFFATACGGCHGPAGQGGRGPNLADGRVVRGATNRRLFDAIRKGVPGTEMPPYNLPDDKIWELVAFLRDLTASAFDTEVAGDAAQGRALFFGKAHCAECHMIRGQGGLLGPDLANIGLSRSLARIREAILDPNAEIHPDYRGVTLTTADGHKIEGVARNSSNYAVQLVDRQGRLHLLERGEWRDRAWSPKSLMPDTYATTLTPQEIDNLLAFLSRQSTGSGPARRRQ